ncbi:MAG: right-handed parallel beta-helix repeat-containing protein [Isosphaeraceae bacterium]
MTIAKRKRPGIRGHQPPRPRTRRRVPLLAEALERRSLLASLVYVNTAWTGLPNGTVVQVGQDSYTIGTDAFAKVQPGVDAADSGGNVKVLDGSYDEAVRIARPVLLQGTGEGATVLARGLTITATPDAGARVTLKDLSILAATDDNTDGFLAASGVSYGVHIDATGGSTAPITFQQVLVRSPQVQLVSGVNVVYGAGFAITPNNNTIDDVVLQGVTADHSYTHGMYVLDTGSFKTGTLSHLTIAGSSFDENNAKGQPAQPPYGRNGYGLLITAPTPASASAPSLIADRIVVQDTSFRGNFLKGIYAESLSNATFSNVHVEGNGNVAAVAAFGPSGIDLNLKYGAYSNITIEDSVINNNGTANVSSGTGLSIAARNDGAYAAIPASLTGVTLRDTTIGASPINLALANNVSLGGVALSGVAIDGPSPTAAGTGLAISGEAAGQTLDLGDTALGGRLAQYISSKSSVYTLGDRASYSGVVGEWLTNPQAYAAANRILDAIDDGGSGLVYLRSNQLFVNPGAGNLPRAAHFALPGDRVHVNEGVYSQNLILDKPIAIEGETGTVLQSPPGNGVTILGSPASVELTRLRIESMSPPDASSGILAVMDGTLTVNDVSIAGFATGSLVFVSSGGTGILRTSGTIATEIPAWVEGGRMEGTGSIVGGLEVKPTTTLEPGPLPGVLQVDSAWLNTGSTLTIPIEGELIGTGYSQLYATTLVELSGARLDLQVAPGFVPGDGAQFILVRGDPGVIHGTFAGLPEGSHVPIGGKDAILSYQGGPGGQCVTLSVRGSTVYVDPGGSDAALQTRVDGEMLQIVRNGVIAQAYPLSTVTSLTVDAVAADNSAFSLDMGQAGIMDLRDGVRYMANPLGQSALRVIGTGSSSGRYRADPAHPGDGRFELLGGGKTLLMEFSGLRPTLVSGMSSFTFETTGARGDDAIQVRSTLLPSSIDAYTLTGTSGGVAFESLTFYDIASFTIDTGANDAGAPNPDDVVAFGPMGGPVARGLVGLIVNTGLGVDRLSVDFSGGNPIPAGVDPGLVLQSTTGLATLQLAGGGFATEFIDQATPDSGSVVLADAGDAATTIRYSGVMRIDDTANATQFTLNLGAGPDRLDDDHRRHFRRTRHRRDLRLAALVRDHEPRQQGVRGDRHARPRVRRANRGRPADRPDRPGGAEVNNASSAPTASTSCGRPPGAIAALDAGPHADVTNVTGAGVAAGTTLYLDGGSVGTLNYDTGGLIPTITPGAPATC